MVEPVTPLKYHELSCHSGQVDPFSLDLNLNETLSKHISSSQLPYQYDIIPHIGIKIEQELRPLFESPSELTQSYSPLYAAHPQEPLNISSNDDIKNPSTAKTGLAEAFQSPKSELKRTSNTFMHNYHESSSPAKIKREQTMISNQDHHHHLIRSSSDSMILGNYPPYSSLSSPTRSQSAMSGSRIGPVAGDQVSAIVKATTSVKSRMAYEAYLKRQKRDTNNSITDIVWCPDVEEAFMEAIKVIPLVGRRKLSVNEKSVGRNQLIAQYILAKTGKERTRKQVSSHIQVLKNIFKSDPEFLKLVVNNDKRRESVSSVDTVFSNQQNGDSSASQTSYQNIDNEVSSSFSSSYASSFSSSFSPTLYISPSNFMMYSKLGEKVHYFAKSAHPYLESPVKSTQLLDIKHQFPHIYDLLESYHTDMPVSVFHGRVGVNFPKFNSVTDSSGLVSSDFHSSLLLSVNNISLNDSPQPWRCKTEVYALGGEVLNLDSTVNILKSESKSDNNSQVLDIPFVPEFWATLFNNFRSGETNSNPQGQDEASSSSSTSIYQSQKTTVESITAVQKLYLDNRQLKNPRESNNDDDNFTLVAIIMYEFTLSTSTYGGRTIFRKVLLNHENPHNTQGGDETILVASPLSQNYSFDNNRRSLFSSPVLAPYHSALSPTQEDSQPNPFFSDRNWVSPRKQFSNLSRKRSSTYGTTGRRMVGNNHGISNYEILPHHQIKSINLNPANDQNNKHSLPSSLNRSLSESHIRSSTTTISSSSKGPYNLDKTYPPPRMFTFTTTTANNNNNKHPHRVVSVANGPSRLDPLCRETKPERLVYYDHSNELLNWNLDLEFSRLAGMSSTSALSNMLSTTAAAAAVLTAPASDLVTGFDNPNTMLFYSKDMASHVLNNNTKQLDRMILNDPAEKPPAASNDNSDIHNIYDPTTMATTMAVGELAWPGHLYHSNLSSF